MSTLYSRNPLKSGLLSYRHSSLRLVLPQEASQSPQIGAAVLPPGPGPEPGPGPAVAIPSNRGCCPTKYLSNWVERTLTESQSPQIGAAVLPYYENGAIEVKIVGSQSPQIGAAVLPRFR